jgi:hypothetical protein
MESFSSQFVLTIYTRFLVGGLTPLRRRLRSFVIGRLQRLLFVVGFTYCVIFATLQNLFFTAMMQGDFFGWMSRIYYRWGVAS